MKEIYVLVACEESQRVCKAFREKGATAFSCDIQECSGGHPEWHIKSDVLPILNGDCCFITQDKKLHCIKGKWDLIIAHPPCTYLSVAGANHLYKNKQLNMERLKKGLEAKAFFEKFFEINCNHLVIENPTQLKIFEIKPYNQVIQPYEFGHPYKKRTCLWIKGLPLLKPTDIVQEKETTKKAGNWFNKGGKDRQINRAKTFEGIAKAMADQWYPILTKEKEAE